MSADPEVGADARTVAAAAGDVGPEADRPEVVLYRCPTPTDVLCPCGTVARRLRKLDVPYRVERVPYRRAARPEIVELTGQDRVPLLIDGDEVICDHKRIVEYLRWRYGEDEVPAVSADAGDQDDRSGAGASPA